MVNAVTFYGTKEEAFEIARDSLLAYGITPTEGSAGEEYIAGSRGVSGWSWGELVAVYFREHGDGSVVLWVVSKPKLVTNILAPSWEAPVLAEIRARTNPEDAPGTRRPPGQTSTGTCFAASPDGRIVTAHHVVNDARRITVKLADGLVVDAELETSARGVDLAVLKVGVPTPQFLSLARQGTLRVGEPVFTLGFPARSVLGNEPKFTDGSISALSGIGDEASLIQISVPVQPGNSGGPLMNDGGEVVGIITATAAAIPFFESTGSLPQNVNWAVKVDFLRPLLTKHARQRGAVSSRREAIDRAKKALCLVEASP